MIMKQPIQEKQKEAGIDTGERKKEFTQLPMAVWNKPSSAFHILDYPGAVTQWIPQQAIHQ